MWLWPFLGWAPRLLLPDLGIGAQDHCESDGQELTDAGEKWEQPREMESAEGPPVLCRLPLLETKPSWVDASSPELASVRGSFRSQLSSVCQKLGVYRGHLDEGNEAWFLLVVQEGHR